MSELTQDEDEDLVDFAKAQTDKPKFKVEVDGEGAKIELGDSTIQQRHKIWKALGASDHRFADGLILQIANLTHDDAPDEKSMNFVLGFIREVEPRDQFESLLTLQMAATHMVAMQSARSTLAATHIRAEDGAANRMTKMTRTYVAQLEALKKHRSKASQTVRVERVEVNEGGQAIVGNVAHGGSK